MGKDVVVYRIDYLKENESNAEYHNITQDETDLLMYKCDDKRWETWKFNEGRDSHEWIEKAAHTFRKRLSEIKELRLPFIIGEIEIAIDIS